MKYIWNGTNAAHIALHDIKPWFAEKIYQTGYATISPSKFPLRYFVEATIREKHYRLVFEVVEKDRAIYPVTAFQIKKRTI
ncbi:MAG: hypothetical protein FWG02_03470 [Holophagaceae bacterium]|nr:hypothetical protein [Holophagaceae bacterium]